MTGNMRHGVVEPIFYNKAVVIMINTKSKWKESNQNVVPLVSNNINYIMHYQRLRLKRVVLGWYLAGSIKSMYATHS